MTSFDALQGLRVAGREISWTTGEFTGDRRLDLLVFDDRCDSAVGVERWDVYAGGAVGFAEAPTAYALPPRRCNTNFRALGAVRGSGVELSYSLLDLNADGRKDLVVTSDACDGAVGTAVWDAYLGGPVGFAQSPTPYGLPPPRCEATYRATGASRDAGSRLSYGLFDMNADRRPDLVVQADACDGAVGTAVWDAYPGGPVGFAQSPTPYGLPAARCMTDYTSLYRQRPTSRLTLGASSLACDGRLSLVVYEDACDATVGADHWDVYRGEVNRFAPEPARIALPPARCMTNFNAAARFRPTARLEYAWTSLVVGGTPELVVFSDACDAAVGRAVWDVYPAR